MGADRQSKHALFDAFARIGKAVSSGRRVEALDILANGERGVESLAKQLDLSVANTSQHLQVLSRAGLVVSRREGTSIKYRLASPEVFAFVTALRTLAAGRLAEVERLAEDYLGRDESPPISREELDRRMRQGQVLVIDVRPVEEFQAGHLPGAVSLPIDDLPSRMDALPKDRELVVYCRGPYCAYSHVAVEALRKSGFRAVRLEDGLPEWEVAGLPVER